MNGFHAVGEQRDHVRNGQGDRDMVTVGLLPPEQRPAVGRGVTMAPGIDAPALRHRGKKGLKGTRLK